MSLFSSTLQKFFEDIIVYSEVVSLCNNKCVFCPIDVLNRSSFIKEDVQQKVIEFLKKTSNIKFKVFFHVLGEPLLYKGLERYINDLSKLPNVKPWLSTNGTLLTMERLTSLHNAGLRNIWYSMFYTNEEDYKKNVRTDFYSQAKENLYYLLSKSDDFEKIHIVTFSDNADEILELIKNKQNVSIEIGRRIKEWRFSRIFSFLTRPIYQIVKDFDPRRYICVSVNGDVTYEWRDYNFKKSVGNILNLQDAQILNGYFKSSLILNLFKSPLTKHVSTLKTKKIL